MHQSAVALDSQPVLDVQTIRDRARRQIQNGAVTPNYGLDRDVVLRLLNEALATEIVAVLSYKRQYFAAKSSGLPNLVATLKEHASHDQEHADRLAERIAQLGGLPNFSPVGLAQRSHAEYCEGGRLAEIVRDALVMERVAVESYREMIRFIGDGDPTTRRLLEDLLAVQEQHARNLLSLVEEVSLTEASRAVRSLS
ncbi:MAG: ferritin-like domain-containing protein [Pseudomonadota bacterium]|jgi:Bacterioferritin (cytochrome b1)|nr:MAG: bacterioferritin [Pseudomonadota bacterium]